MEWGERATWWPRLWRKVIPVLWKKIDKEPKRNAAERGQDNWLWERVKGLPHNSGTAANADTQALGEISDAVQAAYAADEDKLGHDAAQSFSPIHNKLMEAIEASQSPAPAPSFRAEDIFAPVSSQRRLLARRARTPQFQWALGLCLVAAVAGGSHELGRFRAVSDTANLPVQSLVDDFDEGLRSPSPFDFVAYRPEDNQHAAAWLSQSVGAKVQLPAPTRAGVRLLGARRHTIEDRPVAQTHYSKDGVPIALYQVRAPAYGLAGMNEVRIGSHVFMTSNRGNYRVVAWRAGEVIMTMVSPLGMERSLQLADALRNNQDPLI